MKKIMIIEDKSKKILTKNAEMADTFFQRLIGLMGRKQIVEDYCLIIDPCNQIHMFNMRFSIDVIYLDSSNKIIAMDKCITPWTIGKKQALSSKVIESNVGFLSEKLTINDILVFKQV